jgi:hypothetical protein
MTVMSLHVRSSDVTEKYTTGAKKIKQWVRWETHHDNETPWQYLMKHVNLLFHPYAGLREKKLNFGRTGLRTCSYVLSASYPSYFFAPAVYESWQSRWTAAADVSVIVDTGSTWMHVTVWLPVTSANVIPGDLFQRDRGLAFQIKWRDSKVHYGSKKKSNNGFDEKPTTTMKRHGNIWWNM